MHPSRLPGPQSSLSKSTSVAEAHDRKHNLASSMMHERCLLCQETFLTRQTNLKHLGRHLIELALYILPRTVEPLEHATTGGQVFDLEIESDTVTNEEEADLEDGSLFSASDHGEKVDKEKIRGRLLKRSLSQEEPTARERSGLGIPVRSMHFTALQMATSQHEYRQWRIPSYQLSFFSFQNFLKTLFGDVDFKIAVSILKAVPPRPQLSATFLARS